jgi:hypothetical protein
VSEIVELVVVDRAGQRLAIPAARVSMIGELPSQLRAVPLQESFGQPPLGAGERCVAIAVRTAEGHTLVSVAGHVTISQVDAADLLPLPLPLAGAGRVAAIVFGEPAAMLVLDVDAVVARGRTER